MNFKEKNLLDLRHSLHSTKASLFFSIGAGGGIALFFGISQLTKEMIVPLLTANIWLIIFVWVSIIHFNECSKIQKEIRASFERKA